MLVAPDRVDAVREFNRFYTRKIGVLHEGLLHTPFTLTEARLLWELAHRPSLTATALSAELDLDSGYLSRLLKSFKDRKLIRAARSAGDARQFELSLTAAGRKAFAPLDRRSRDEVGALLGALAEDEQRALLASMQRIRRMLGEPADAATPFILRPHGPGDIGWVIARHGALYAQEYGWDLTFEALVAEIAARFVTQFEPKREHCWIAERDGENVGCVFLVQARDEKTNAPIGGVGQLRLLLVEPSARGLKLGDTLVRECERFARRVGYTSIRLWTNSVLHAARHIYQKHGYRLVASEKHKSFGRELVGQTWELALR